MAFSTAGFMGGLAQLIQGKQQNALANQQAKEQLDDRRLMLAQQADQLRRQRIEEDRAAKTFEEQQAEWAQRKIMRPGEKTAQDIGLDVAREDLAGKRTNNSLISLQLDDYRNQSGGRKKLFDLGVETPRMQEKRTLTEKLSALDATINAQQTIVNDVTKSRPEREAAQAAIKSAMNMKYATFTNAKGNVGIVPNLTYSDIAEAAGIRQPDPTKPVDWNTYTNWESHFPQYTAVPLRNVLSASPEGLKSLQTLNTQIASIFDPTKHITKPTTFFDVTKEKGPDGKDFYKLNPNTPKFEFNKSALSAEYFNSPAFTQWLRSEAAANRSTQADVIQQLIGIPLNQSTYGTDGKLLKAGDVDKDGNVIMTPALSNRIAANYSTRIATPEKLNDTINQIASQYSDNQRNAITFWNAQLQSGDVKRTADAARLTASLSAQSDVFKSANDSYMKNMNSVDAELSQLSRTLGAISTSGLSGAALIFDEEFKKNADASTKRIIQTARELYRKKALATMYETVARTNYGKELSGGNLGKVGAYANGVGIAANILNSPYREYTKDEKDMFKALGMPLPGASSTTPTPTNTNPPKPTTPTKPAISGNQQGAGFGIPSNTPLTGFRVGPIDNRQR